MGAGLKARDMDDLATGDISQAQPGLTERAPKLVPYCGDSQLVALRVVSFLRNAARVLMARGGVGDSPKSSTYVLKLGRMACQATRLNSNNGCDARHRLVTREAFTGRLITRALCDRSKGATDSCARLAVHTPYHGGHVFCNGGCRQWQHTRCYYYRWAGVICSLRKVRARWFATSAMRELAYTHRRLAGGGVALPKTIYRGCGQRACGNPNNPRCYRGDWTHKPDRRRRHL
jgi:hypothetical protein